MKKNRATYQILLRAPDTVGHSYIIHHVRGHPNCTPEHAVYTSPITSVCKNGRFHTTEMKYILICCILLSGCAHLEKAGEILQNASEAYFLNTK